MAETLPKLPDIVFVNSDAQTVINALMQSYEEVTGRKLADGDPVRLWLLGVAYVIQQFKAENNTAAKNNLLYFASDAFLDYIGQLRNTARLEAEPARDRLRWSLSASRLVPTTIPKGTRVTSDNELYWQTEQALVIPAGQLHGVVPCVSMTAGVAGNVIQPGQLTTIVDPVAYVASVTNLDGGQGGRDREDAEAYRYRLYMAPASFSVAGPVDAYKFWAYTASPAISDVLAYSPTPMTAEVRVLLEGGEIPDSAILDKVVAVLSPKDRRPMCDKLEVKASDAVPYNITASYYIRREDQALAPQITEAANQALQAYIQWQRAKMGRDIDPGELNARLRAAGVKRAVITSPAYTELDGWQVAQEATVAPLEMAGFEDD